MLLISILLPFYIVHIVLLFSFPANRSFCYFKLECCGDAIRDATKAIELDPTYEKGYSSLFYCIHSVDGIVALQHIIIPQNLKNLLRTLDNAINSSQPQRIHSIFSIIVYSVHKKIDDLAKLIKKIRFEQAIHVEISSFADDIIFSELRTHHSQVVTFRL